MKEKCPVNEQLISAVNDCKVEEELYYRRSKSKGSDQLCSYCTADLCLCFRICKNPVFTKCIGFLMTLII